MKISKVLSFVLIAALLILAVSCAQPEAKHVHAKGTHNDAVAATCKDKGTLEYWDCTGCEEKLDADGKALASIEGELDPDNHALATTHTVNTGSPIHHDLYSDCCNVFINAVYHSAPCSACGFNFDF